MYESQLWKHLALCLPDLAKTCNTVDSDVRFAHGHFAVFGRPVLGLNLGLAVQWESDSGSCESET